MASDVAVLLAPDIRRLWTRIRQVLNYNPQPLCIWYFALAVGTVIGFVVRGLILASTGAVCLQMQNGSFSI